ncbi:MAG: hypothetical protein ABSG13_19370 [Bryobacteraceae bacterium]
MSAWVLALNNTAGTGVRSAFSIATGKPAVVSKCAQQQAAIPSPRMTTPFMLS